MTTHFSPPVLPDTAPFTAAQRAWLNGFFAGFFAPSGTGPQPAAAPEKPTIALTILYGTQTGTAASLGKSFAKEATKRGFAAQAKDMAEFTVAQLQDVTNLLVITSTYGDGEPPDGARALHAALHADDAPALNHLSFSVLGLGDTNYEKFCECAKEFDLRLEKLGARRIHERTDCDVDYESSAQAWLQGALANVTGHAPPTAPTSLPAPAESTAPLAYGKANPFPARLLDNRLLNGSGSAKETRHLAFSLEGSGLSYEAGDALGVLPVNCAELVESILRATGFDGEEAVTSAGGKEKSLRFTLTRDYDISGLNKTLIEKFVKFRPNPELAALLAPERAGELSAYLAGRHWIDLLTAYPIIGATAGEFTALLKKLQPRLYSIASSPQAHPGEVHLCVGIVRYDSHGRARKGVCSTYLAERIDETAGVFVHHNTGFRLPAPDRDVIMIGPGTGIAPFRAFLEERRAIAATGRNWLFFGDQRAATDLLYREELTAMQKDGTLARLDLAFSRNQAEKIYVQHRMMENGAELWAWLQSGAHLYICGDASRMAKDVDTALHTIVEKHGSLTPEAARTYITSLKSAKRYQRDVY